MNIQFKKRIKRKISYLMGIKYISKFSQYKNQKKIFYLSTPYHGNMGDQAIAEASVQFFNDKFSEYKVIEVYRENINKYAKAIKKNIKEDDLIFIHGGGNMGNLYISEEETRRQIIKYFKRNSIISMTQTITFSADKEGEQELQKTKKIYNNHNNLSLIAREKKSYDKMKKEFSNANILVNPDIVFYLLDKLDYEKEKRDRVMSCLRGDKEGILGKQKDKIINYLRENYEDYFEYDTHIAEKVPREKRNIKLMQMLDEFKKSKVVITDRLHGMVFCVITKTPCIVTKSLDHKVTGTYEWVKELNYIRLVDDLKVETIEPLIQELSELKELTTIDFNQDYFNTLRERLGV